MAKITFRRVVTVLHRYYAVACLPVIGGVLFLFGSLFFLPEAASHRSHVIGALCFIIGSLCYLLAPLMDFVELQINLTNLVDQIPSPSSRDDSPWEILQIAALADAARHRPPLLRLRRVLRGGLVLILPLALLHHLVHARRLAIHHGLPALGHGCDLRAAHRC